MAHKRMHIDNLEEKLSDDLVAEIFSYLPLKTVVRCKCLSKNYKEIISEQSFSEKLALRLSRQNNILFHCSKASPTFFQTVRLNPPYVLNHDLDFQADLSHVTRVFASCNGLLLLSFEDSDFLCLCNPITKQYQFIEKECHVYRNIFGLAVDPVKSLIFPAYKVVFICSKWSGNTFFIISPGKNKWKKSITIPNVCRDNFAENTNAVYLNGSLHWLQKSGDIVAFHPDKEQYRIITKPPMFRSGCKLSFGSVQQMIAIVSVLNGETIINMLHDYEEGKWQIRAEISRENIRNGSPISLIDDQLIVLEPYATRAMFSFNLDSKSWTKIQTLQNFLDWDRSFGLFCPSLAKVSEIDINEEKEKNKNYDIIQSMDKLCKIFRSSL